MILILAQSYRRMQRHAREEGYEPHQWRPLQRATSIDRAPNPLYIDVLPDWMLDKNRELVDEIKAALREAKRAEVRNF